MEPKIVFADFFDTTVLRNASPNDVIFNFCRMLGEKYSTEPSTIYKTFWKCKNHLAVERFLKNGESEYTFDELIFCVAREIKKVVDIDTDAFIADGATFYIEAEAASHTAKQQTVKILRSYKSKGAKIVLLSDFYCKADMLKIWLERLNIADIFDDIIVSCECGKSKRSGKLFDVALARYGVAPKDTLMIGDSIRSDCHNASKRKMNCIHLKQPRLPQSRELKLKIKYGANYPQLKRIFEQYPEYRFSNYAFNLYLFEKRLCAQLEEKNIKNVFFLAREGRFLKKLFDIYRDLTGKCKDVTAHYLYVSRNSVLPASLRPLGSETFDKVFPGVLCVTLRKFLTTLGFSDSETETIAREIGTKPDRIFADMPHSAMFARLCSNKIFREKYDSMRQSQSELFTAYWESFGVDIYREKIAVVDVGWSGTMQTLMERHFDGNVNMVGFYVGARDKTEQDRSTKFGLLYSRKNKRSHIFRHNMTYYEQILRANHSRTDGYAVVDGKPQPVLDNKIDDAFIYKKDIEPMQKKIAAKFKQICKLDFDHCSVMDDIVARAFYKMSLHPTEKDMEWIMRCEDTHYDRFMRIGYTFAPYRHAIRLIVRTTEKIVFALRHFGRQKVRIVVPQKQKKSADTTVKSAEQEEIFS